MAAGSSVHVVGPKGWLMVPLTGQTSEPLDPAPAAGAPATASEGVAAAKAVPAGLADLFAPAGEFEGRALTASKPFRD